MNPAEATYKQVAAPQSVNSAGGGLTCNVIDTAGFDYLELIVSLGVGPGATALQALYLSESDSKNSNTALNTTDASYSQQIPGTVFGTSLTVAAPTSLYPETPTNPASTLPANNTTIELINVDLKGRKRYLLPVINAGANTATLLDVVARMTRTEVAPHLPAQIVPTNGQVLQVPAYALTANGL